MGKSALAASFAVFFGMLTGTGGAAEIEVARIVQGTPTRIFVTGELFEGDEKLFSKKIIGIEDGIVIFDSPGGDVAAGLGIGRLLRARGFSTLVPANYECASACALAWLSGNTRYLSSEGAVGFHAAYYLENDHAQERGAPNAIVGAYLGGLGMSDDAIIFFTSAPPESMNWLSIHLAGNLGIEVLPWNDSTGATPGSERVNFANQSRSGPPAVGQPASE